jgi:hypothetical protein
MINTIADAIKMYAWSPDWYHWFKFSSAVMMLGDAHGRPDVTEYGVNSLESPPNGKVPLNCVGLPVQE